MCIIKTLKSIRIQVFRFVSDLGSDFDFRCAASADSILDYGQYAISQSGTGHIMYSAATAQSTMDFSTKAIDDDVVDSPPFGGKRPHSVSSPSPLKSRTPITSPKSSTRNVGAPQRKLYDDSEMVDLPVPKEVWFTIIRCVRHSLLGCYCKLSWCTCSDFIFLHFLLFFLLYVGDSSCCHALTQYI